MRVPLVTVLMTAAMVAPGLSEPSQLQAPQFLPGDVPKYDVPKPPPHAEPDVVPAPKDADPCAASISERNGVVTLVVNDAARADQTTTFALDDRIYGGQFDHAGRLEAEAPLLHRLGELSWDGSNKERCYRHGIVFSNFQTTFEIALIFDARADALALHVVEPSGRVGGAQYYVAPDRPNADNSYALGQLHVYGTPVVGTSRAQVYSLPADRMPSDGTIYAFVEFAGRGNPARAPFCGDDAMAVISYEIDRLDGGSVERRKARFGAVACGTGWAGQPEESGYFQMWKYKL